MQFLFLGRLVLFGVGELLFHGGGAGGELLVVPAFARALGELIDEGQMGRFESGNIIPYIVAQVLGGIAAAIVF